MYSPKSKSYSSSFSIIIFSGTIPGIIYSFGGVTTFGGSKTFGITCGIFSGIITLGATFGISPGITFGISFSLASIITSFYAFYGFNIVLFIEIDGNF